MGCKGSLLAVATLVTAFTVESRAVAYERQWHLGGSLGYALDGDASGLANGIAAGAYGAYGLNDTFNAIASLEASYRPGSRLGVASASVGAAYVFDVLRWVPYVGLTAGAFELASLDAACTKASCRSTRFGASVPLGLDYELNRSFAVGGQARYDFLPSSDGITHQLTLSARAEYSWGY